MAKVKDKLERMEQENIISRVEGPTDWCAGIVVVPKPNKKVCICVDLTQLNKCVKRERHILPSIDHTLAQLGSDLKLYHQFVPNFLQDSVLMRNNQIVIPQSLQPDILQKLRSGHQGISKCHECARHSVGGPASAKIWKLK